MCEGGECAWGVDGGVLFVVGGVRGVGFQDRLQRKIGMCAMWEGCKRLTSARLVEGAVVRVPWEAVVLRRLRRNAGALCNAACSAPCDAYYVQAAPAWWHKPVPHPPHGVGPA